MGWLSVQTGGRLVVQVRLVSFLSSFRTTDGLLLMSRTQVT